MKTILGKKVSEAAYDDIAELQQKISAFGKGEIPEDKFKAYRLTRGVYGQRQLGVHMFRTKIPYGRLQADQLIRIADISEKYTHGNLHLTTRQNIQLHHVKLADSPAIWAELAEAGVTAREACGNTVRNLTASATAGIDPDELFDVSPYVHAAFEYFLRNPICQEMGRKIKPAFSSSDSDSAFVFIHDFGFIPRVREVDGKEERGFKLVIGGGLGAQPAVAQTAFEFISEQEILPFMEAAIRVFDRYGERAKRFKARMKFLIKQMGMEAFMALVEEEKKSLENQEIWIDRNAVPEPEIPSASSLSTAKLNDLRAYDLWYKSNVFEQKQSGYFGVFVRVPLGDIHANTARELAAIVKKYAADDIRITVQQGLLFRYVRPEALPHVYLALDELGLALPGHNSVADVTACPGTDTCNLSVTNSTGLAGKLEEVIETEYPDLIFDANLNIKISGCMNACGQHMIAEIGFHGSSIKKGVQVIPAMQVVLGGGKGADGQGVIAEKVIKLPTKRIPDSLRLLLADFEEEAIEGETFPVYFQRQGKRYFYQLLKPLADTDSVAPEEFLDWGKEVDFLPEIGVGECAGVSFDVVGSIIADAEEKVSLAAETLSTEDFPDSIYHAYSAFVIGAKALLLADDIKCNTQIGILKDFDSHFEENRIWSGGDTFTEHVLRMKKEAPTQVFAARYLEDAKKFIQAVRELRNQQTSAETDKEVIEHYYKA